MNLRKTINEIDQKYHDRKVVGVDELDNELGVVGLIEAHQNIGIQHRAFSLQLFRKVDGKVELLLQQRSDGKPMFPFLWANTCCYNMAPGETYLERAVSRVKEEMGIDVELEKLKIAYKFIYFASDVGNWCENELDTVIVGEWDGKITPNPDEAMDYKWIEWDELRWSVETKSDIYAPWFKIILKDERFRLAIE